MVTAFKDCIARRSEPALITLCLIFSLAISLWWALDHTYPQWDAANHTLAALHYASLIKHPHILSSAWQHEFWTVDYQYPLVVNITSALCKVVAGNGRASEILAYLIFQNILTVSVYGLARTLTKDRLVAALSTVLINVYPLVNCLSHVQLLDYGSLCFDAFALFGLARWVESRSRQNIILMCLSVALAANCKQISAFFVIVPCATLLLFHLFKNNRKRVVDLVIAGGTTAALMALWVVPNYARLKAASAISSAECLQNGPYLSVVASHTAHYLSGMAQITSPFLFVVLIAAIINLIGRQSEAKKLWLPLLANIGGFVCMCFVAASRAEMRYVVPLAISMSLISAIYLAALFRSKHAALRFGAAGVMAVAAVQYLVYNFMPYPLPLPFARSGSDIRVIKEYIQTPLKEGLVAPPSNPLPPGDRWGQVWVIDQIVAGGGGNLNILPSTAEISVHTLEVVAAYRKAAIDISTFRRFTLNGDDVQFDDNAISYYRWYLLKSGQQTGFKFSGEASAANYARLTGIIETSGRFESMGKRTLPDGSELKLYRALPGR